MSDSVSARREAVELLSCVRDAAHGLAPWELPQSVLGRLRRAVPPTESEYLMFASRDVGRSARYLADVLIPSFQRRPPGWMPPGIRGLLFHETTVTRCPDQDGRLDSVPAEHWFFINGILTNRGMAEWNAAYLARVFQRPFTVIQNATDGPIADLLECAGEKAFGMNGESADVAFPAVYRALKDPDRERIVVIAHSQGTLIAAVILKLLHLVYARADELTSPEHRRAVLEHLRRTGVTLDPGDFDAVTVEELRRLEVYCFANCASEMRYVDGERELPWIESFGNEHDLVARLGMLAPDRTAEEIAIDGPMWIRPGGWGHLLNHHYLRPIDEARRSAGAAASGPAAPYEPWGPVPGPVPRLYGYLDGGAPDPVQLS